MTYFLIFQGSKWPWASSEDSDLLVGFPGKAKDDTLELKLIRNNYWLGRTLFSCQICKLREKAVKKLSQEDSYIGDSMRVKLVPFSLLFLFLQRPACCSGHKEHLNIFTDYLFLMSRVKLFERNFYSLRTLGIWATETNSSYGTYLKDTRERHQICRTTRPWEEQSQGNPRDLSNHSWWASYLECHHDVRGNMVGPISYKVHTWPRWQGCREPTPAM